MINKYLLRFFSLHFGCEKCKIKREKNENKIKVVEGWVISIDSGKTTDKPTDSSDNLWVALPQPINCQ